MDIEDRKSMSKDIKRHATEVLGMDIVGIASIDRYTDCPREFHPQRLLPNSEAVITMGLVHNLEMVKDSHIHKGRAVVDTHAMNTENLRAGYRLAKHIQKRWGYPSGAAGLPVHLPAAFMREALKDVKEAVGSATFFSVKMAALLGGLGKRGVNDLLIHPKHGTVVRLVSVATQAPLIDDQLADFEPMCDECHKPCIKECPTGAISVKENDPHTKGLIDWQKCLNLIANEALMLGYVACLQCAVVCPHSQGENR